jgi:three-Cys-motif partner protein
MSKSPQHFDAQGHSFGDDWTEQKLEILRKFLPAYTNIMARHNFRFAYVDAFAGTGYRTVKTHDKDEWQKSALPDFEEPESNFFDGSAKDGSAKIALDTKPQFQTCIFIEKDERRFTELKSLSQQNEYVGRDIRLIQEDANSFLEKFCKKKWKKHRAVLFLDPYGMQVSWKTLTVIAHTKAIDTWILFPLGIGVNRLLTKDGNIPPQWRARLDDVFGEPDWYDVFYAPNPQASLFPDGDPAMHKIAGFDAIGKYYIERLKTIFRHVAKNPFRLHNSCNNPMYLLCFAAANKTALKIAEDVMD